MLRAYARLYIARLLIWIAIHISNPIENFFFWKLNWGNYPLGFYFWQFAGKFDLATQVLLGTDDSWGHFGWPTEDETDWMMKLH